MPAVGGSLEQAYDAQAGARQRAGTLARRYHANAGGVPSPDDQGWTSALRVAQADDRTGVRDHQIGDVLSPPLAARVEEGHRRVDAGLAGVESEAHGRIAPTPGKTRGKPSARPERQWPGNSLFRIVKFAGLAGAQSDRRLALEAH